MEKHFVYVIARRTDEGLVGPVKVGITKSLGARLAALQTGCWDKLEVAYQFKLSEREVACEVERQLHEMFVNFRMQGEWFEVEPLFALEALCGIVFDYIEARTSPSARQAILVACGAVDNLKTVADEFWQVPQ